MSETISVTQLNNRVKTLMKHGSVNDLWVSGEISGLKKYASGHYYFTIKDDKSSVSAVLFAGNRKNMSFEPKDGDKIEAFGSADLYSQTGKYQFMVSTMRHSGVGELYIKFEELKERLKAEGLFDESRKRPLPKYPRRIGVVTSQSGAVIHDIITTSASRFPADIYLAPSQVQGDGAAKTIVAGIELLNRYGVDVIIVARGGGSLEDLWCFNEEIVARAIVASKIPVVSAVGHETDFTISDFVSDLRAPTPTGAAALILRDRSETASDVDSLMSRAGRSLETAHNMMASRFEILSAKLSPEHALDDMYMRVMNLDDLAGRADRSMQNVIAQGELRLERLMNRASIGRSADSLEHKSVRLEELSLRAARALSSASDAASARLLVAESRISPEKIRSDMRIKELRVESAFSKISSIASENSKSCGLRFSAIGSRPDAAMNNIVGRATSYVDALSRNLEGLNPLNILGRGYGLITSDDGSVITSLASMPDSGTIGIRMRDGTAKAEIKSKELKE
ncbi:MAG: exodeoxyribonuclease VII large subunit [Candidatus Methanomethylophilaceae archaeon]|nr:exodeoxyribonuclease VII large subunit [Candidatus Methanomethylophilaceae archaeon]